MPTRIKHIKMLLEQVEELKRQIVLVDSNRTLAFSVKTERLADMRQSLFLTEHLALKLMQDEIQECGDE